MIFALSVLVLSAAGLVFISWRLDVQNRRIKQRNDELMEQIDEAHERLRKKVENMRVDI